MLIYFVTFISFIVFYKYSLPTKQLPTWASEMRLLSFYFWQDLSVVFPSAGFLKNANSLMFKSKMASKTKKKSFSDLNKDTTKKVETNELSLLDLPDLALESILEKLDPADLSRTACVSTYLKDICLTDYLWKHHMKQKWGRLIGCAAMKEWQLHIASQKDFLGGGEKICFLMGYLSKLWPVMMFQSGHTNDERKCSQPLNGCSVVSCFRALETGKFWFPAQVFNRENGHVGFVMSCYNAELRYDCHSNTFEARYPAHGSREVATENGVTWDRLREAHIDDSPHDLHTSDCLKDLRPKDHIEIQWRRNKQFPYGWWYGVIGHLESCDGNDTYCRCHENGLKFRNDNETDIVVLEFKQYAAGSRWRHMTINRHDHHDEEGNEEEGFYGGIKKLYNKDEISMWQQFWPTDILE